MNLAKGHERTIAVAALIVVAIVAGSLAFYFAEQVSSLNAQVSTLEYQNSSLHGALYAAENQTTALKDSGMALCQNINATLPTIHQALSESQTLIGMQVSTVYSYVMLLNTYKPANFSTTAANLINTEVSKAANLLNQLPLVGAKTQLNDFYYPSNFCSFAGKS